jgi:hypothetical protein
VSINGVTLESGASVIPPETLEQLRKYHRFIPKQSLEHLEQISGQDIDGDGHIGATPATAASRTTSSSASHLPSSGAMPTNAAGPFVQRGMSGRAKLIAWFVAFDVAVLVAAYFLFVR